MSYFAKILSVAFALFLYGCSSIGAPDTPERETGTVKLLTLGDSRVEGAPPNFESYRYALWKQIVQSNMKLDFIGPLRDPYRYQSFKGQIFDPDHAGVGGFTTTDILEHLDDALSATFVPDIVLLGIGGNDLIGTDRSPDEIVENVAQIIQRLRAKNPNVTILVEQIAPGKPDFMSGDLTRSFNRYNDMVAGLAADLTSEKSPIMAVDMTEGWDNTYLTDDVHYNRAGAQHVAQKYFDALKAIRVP